MKAKDFGVIALVAIISGVVSILLSGVLFATPEDRKQKVEVVEPISTTFERPDSRYFNNKSVNPSQNIDIGNDPNSNPFIGR
jgi:hypothetical protein